MTGRRAWCSECSRGSYARAASSRHAPPSRVLLASPAPRSLAFAPPPRAADVSSALSLVPVAPALRHALNSAPCPRVLGPLRSSCGCIRHVRQGRSSGWLEVPRRSRSANDSDSTKRHATAKSRFVSAGREVGRSVARATGSGQSLGSSLPSSALYSVNSCGAARRSAVNGKSLSGRCRAGLRFVAPGIRPNADPSAASGLAAPTVRAR